MRLPPARVTASGRAHFDPTEAERRLLAKVDLEFTNNAGKPEILNRGVLYVTDKRIIWVGDGNPPSHAVSICLESISKIVPFKWSMLSSSTPRVKLHLHIDTNSLPTSDPASAVRDEVVCLIFRGASASHTQFTTDVQGLVGAIAKARAAGSRVSRQAPANPAPHPHHQQQQQQQPLYPMAASPFQPPAQACKPLDWTCAACTLINASDAQVCLACGSPRPAAAAPLSQNARTWQCAACTLVNSSDVQVCGACNAPIPAPSVGLVQRTPQLANSNVPPYPTPPSQAYAHNRSNLPAGYPPLHFNQGAGGGPPKIAYPPVHGAGPAPNTAQAPAPNVNFTASAAGITGLLRKEQEKQEQRNRNLEDAFRDLDGLMQKAGEMVQMGEMLRLRVRKDCEEGGALDAGVGQEMDDLLLDVGIVNPVTKESAGALYHKQLSRQLADFLGEVLDRRGGVMALPDIFCIFNRARGTELVSPDDLQQACRLWPKLGLALRLDKLASGVQVVKSNAFSDDEVCSKIEEIVAPAQVRASLGIGPGASASDTAAMLSIPLPLAQEYLLMAERRGAVCRDDGPEGLRFYRNFFLDEVATK
mmetsp:Transcript_13413/g.25644  ORF Transcript_13413/g.25644 Transcript_13413/m.25644 type:complete len:588 (-) Transcript_13413:289-2052(-)